jgi:hypothetical protein
MSSTALVGTAISATGLAQPPPRAERRDSSLAVPLPLAKRVAKNSEVTSTYDAYGRYPVLRLFQIARPIPEPRPFGSLPVQLDEIGHRHLIDGAYRKTESPYSGLVDRRL